MSSESRQDPATKRRLSRRAALKGGLVLAAGGLATIVSSNAAADAVTPLDVKRVMNGPRGGTRPIRRPTTSPWSKSQSNK
jgi:hypothetical protein